MTAHAITGERMTRGHVLTLALLAVVVMFEGFDVSATSVVLPYLSAEFGTPTERLGQALAIIALGSMAAWVLLRLADRFGRRPLLLIAAAGFSLGSLATVLSDSVETYTGIQLVTRALLVSQVALAYLIVSESLPPKLRGRANGLLGAMGSFGAALPFMTIAPALETPLGWRLLFVIGAAPLLMMPLLFWRLRETPVWLAARERGLPRPSALAELKQLAAPGLRRSFVAMSLLWFIINFGPSGYGDMADSFGAILGRGLVPFFAPIGLGYWQISLALLAGISAKEVVVSSFAVLFDGVNINSTAALANLAASRVVARLGTYAVTRDELKSLLV